MALQTAAAEVISEMTQRIVDEFHPLQVILFGSHARGDARPDSDIDLLVVVSESEDRPGLATEIRRSLSRYDVDKDIVVATPGKLGRLGNVVGYIFRPALREGRILWGSTARPAASEAPVVERDEAVRRWFHQAKGDIETAERLLDEGEYLGLSCYLAQQGAEKSLKTILVFLQLDYPHSHDLQKVMELVPEGWRVRAGQQDLTGFSEWAFRGRYPEGAEATLSEAREAVRQARAIFQATQRDLEERGL